MSEAPRIVVTGRGLVGPTGCGAESVLGGPNEALRRAEPLFDGRSQDAEGVGHFDARGYDTSALATAWVGAARGFDAASMLGDDGNVRLLDRASAMLIRATGEALEESGFDEAARAECEVGLVLGTTFSSAHTIAAFDRRAVAAGPRYASPLDFANTVINAATGQTAIWFNLRGINSTVAGEAASSLEALGYALRALRSGQASALLVGGVEELSLELLLGLERLNLLHLAVAGDEPPRPWASSRSGFAASEGAAVVMLETLEKAQARSATIYGEILGAGVGFDPSFAYAPFSRTAEGALEGADEDPPDAPLSSAERALGAAVSTALDQAVSNSEAIDLLVSGASGSVRADVTEAKTFARTFCATNPPVVAPKAEHGEPLGAGGTMALLAALALLDGGDPVAASAASAEGLARWYPGSLMQAALGPRAGQRRALLTMVGWAGHSAAVVVGDAQDLR